MEALKLLSRNEMKNIKGGYMQASCRVAVRNSDGSFGYWSACVSYDDAIGDYGTTFSNGSYGSGYCCESCGDEGFSNADPC